MKSVENGSGSSIMVVFGICGVLLPDIYLLLTGLDKYGRLLD